MFIEYKFKSKYKNDCALRAVSKALDISYEQVYEDLQPNYTDMGVIIKYLCKKYKFIDCGKMSLYKFCKKYKDGKYIVMLDGHLTYVYNGDIYDTWDCSNKITFFAYKVS